jgi:SAM-dependent methyltransferase
VVELGCGCGRVARALRDRWFEGTYLGVDIDEEMIEYCRQSFIKDRFQFMLSPHRSATYSSNGSGAPKETASELVLAEPDSKDFVFSISLYSHLLERKAVDYIQESFRILRKNGVMQLTFFCMEHVTLGQRWSFQHRAGNAYIENPRYPEAAVAYHANYMIGLAERSGFREVSINPGNAQSELVARK